MGIAICHRRKFGQVPSSPIRSCRKSPVPVGTPLDLWLPHGKIGIILLWLGCRLVTARYVLGVLYRENRSKSENSATLTPRCFATVCCREKLTDLGNSLALGLQHGVNSISLQCIPWLVTCSEWGARLTNFRFQILGQMTPKVNFWICLSGFCNGTLNYVSWSIWWKSAVAKLPEGPLDYHTKNSGSADSSQPPFCPKWADRAQNSLNIVTFWHVHIDRIWSGSAALCQAYSRKIDFSAPKVNTI